MLEWVGVLNREVSTKLCLKMRGRHAEFRDYEARNPHLTPLCHSALPSKRQVLERGRLEEGCECQLVQHPIEISWINDACKVLANAQKSRQSGLHQTPMLPTEVQKRKNSV